MIHSNEPSTLDEELVHFHWLSLGRELQKQLTWTWGFANREARCGLHRESFQRGGMDMDVLLVLNREPFESAYQPYERPLLFTEDFVSKRLAPILYCWYLPIHSQVVNEMDPPHRTRSVCQFYVWNHVQAPEVNYLCKEPLNDARVTK